MKIGTFGGGGGGRVGRVRVQDFFFRTPLVECQKRRYMHISEGIRNMEEY